MSQDKQLARANQPVKNGSYQVECSENSSPEIENNDLATDPTDKNLPEPGIYEEVVFQESLILSNRDRDIVLSTLENPPELNETLKLAIKKFRNKYGK